MEGCSKGIHGRVIPHSVPIPSRLAVQCGVGGRIVRERAKRDFRCCYARARGEGMGKGEPSPDRRLSIAKAALSQALEAVECRKPVSLLDFPASLLRGVQFLPNLRQWNAITETLVTLSTVAFLFLLVPQLVKNTVGMAAGNMQAMAILSWKGYGMAMLGNTLLLSYFLDRSERSAAKVQVVGISSNFAMLSQIFFAGFMPLPAYVCSLTVLAASSVVSACKASGVLSRSPRGWEVWRCWRDLLGVVGVAAVPQAIWSTFVGTQTCLPTLLGLATAVTLVVLDRKHSLPDTLANFWAAIPGWAATMLFAFQPLAQLANNVADPGSLAGLSAGSLLLGMIGNGLMVPRGLLTGDSLWAVGSAWACFSSWAQLLTLYLGRSATTGLPYVPQSVFMTTTLGLLAYASVTLKCDAHAKGLLSPWASVRYLLTGSMDEASGEKE